MPELNTFACDVCGVTKKETNRWWMVCALEHREAEPASPEKIFVCVQFDLEFWKEAQKEHEEDVVARAVACGEEHAQQLFARWLVSGSFDAPSQRPVTDGTGQRPVTREVVGAPLAAPDPSVPTREEGKDV